MKPKWNNQQIKTLFNIVEKNNKLGKPTLNSFDEYAKMSNKIIVTIRNFYYSFLKILKDNLSLQKELNINIHNHSIETFEHFDNLQSLKIKNKIEKLTKQGMSVRGACLQLSNGDYKKMLRLQNKYRNMTYKKNKEKIEINQKDDVTKKQIMQLLKNEFNSKINKNEQVLQNNNKNEQTTVYKFPSQISKKDFKNKLTDDDIKSLFLGLVNLVKENAKSDNQQRYEAFLEKTQEDKRRHILELEEKQNEIAKLNQHINELKAKNIALNKTLENYRIDFVSKIDYDNNNFSKV